MRKIKILHVSKGFYPETVGGIETFIDLLSNELKKFCEFGLFCVGTNTRIYKHKNLKIYKFKKTFEISSCPFSYEALINFKKISSNYDIIHYHYPYPFMDILNLFVFNKKKITTYHSDIIKQKFLNFFYFPLKMIFLQSQKFLVVSSKQYLKTSKDLQYFKLKTKIIHFGINLIKVKFNKNLENEKYILFLGSLRYYKGLNILLEAAKYINCKIYICGTGIELSSLIALKKKLKLYNVFFLGYVNDYHKRKLLKNSQLFVFPSNTRAEAFGFAILEAMAFAKPIISCNIGSATSYLNLNNITGFVIKPNDPIMLSKKINFLLDPKNHKIKKKFGLQSLLRVKKYFNSNIMASKYLKIYQTVLNI
jgi:glycosyltransferase involved in cell wall biosynthesis